MYKHRWHPERSKLRCLEFSRGGNLDLGLGLPIPTCTLSFDFLDDVQSFGNFSKNHVLAVEPRGIFGANKDCTLGRKRGEMYE